MASVGGDDEVARRVDGDASAPVVVWRRMSAARTKDNRSVNSDAAARVHLDGESVGDGGHRLHQGQGRLRCGAHRRLLEGPESESKSES